MTQPALAAKTAFEEIKTTEPEGIHEVVEFPLLRRHIEIEADRKGYTGQLRYQYIEQRFQQEKNLALREEQGSDLERDWTLKTQPVADISDDHFRGRSRGHQLCPVLSLPAAAAPTANLSLELVGFCRDRHVVGSSRRLSLVAGIECCWGGNEFVETRTLVLPGNERSTLAFESP